MKHRNHFRHQGAKAPRADFILLKYISDLFWRGGIAWRQGVLAVDAAGIY